MEESMTDHIDGKTNLMDLFTKNSCSGKRRCLSNNTHLNIHKNEFKQHAVAEVEKIAAT